MNETGAPNPARLSVGLWLCAGAFAIHAALGLIAHHSLRTNAFDLSVFDYALWTTVSGAALGYVPMFEHSLFAQHFMPTLLLLAPLSRLFDTPAYLIVLQALFHGCAAFLLFSFAGRYVSRRMALALTVAFLFSRRSNVALMSFFYIESAEPMLIFGALLAWSCGHRILYWTLTVLALGCKEDVAIYFLAFGAMLAVTGQDRSTGLRTIALAGAWLMVSVFVAIPYWRSVYGLPAANPFLEERYGVAAASSALPALLTRLVSRESLSEFVTVTSATGLLCVLSPAWMAVAVPGILMNLATVPGSGQAGLSGHYLWPILPWLFVAAVFGARRIPSRASGWVAFAIVLVTLIEAPLPRSIAGRPWNRLRDAGQVRSQLDALTLSGTVTAQPNLVPHLPRQMRMYGLGYSAAHPAGDYVLLTRIGDLWPLDEAGVTRELARLGADVQYEQISSGPLFAFRRVR